MKQTLISTPEEDALNQLKAEVAALNSRKSDIIDEIRLRETRRNDASIIKARDNAWQRQSVTDEANATYHAESKAIGVLHSELNEIGIRLMPMQRQLGELTHEVYEKKAKRQYEAHTVTSTQANIAMYQKSYTELKAKLDNVNAEIVKLNKQADSHADDIERCEVLKTKWLTIKDKFDHDAAAYRLDKSSDNPLTLKSRCIPLDDAKIAYEKALQLVTDYKDFPKLISEKRERLSSEAASISAEIKTLSSEMYQCCSLIEQIQFNAKINEALQHLPLMVAYDDLAGGAKTGRDIINHLSTRGITKPNGSGLAEPHEVLNGLLDNLIKIQAQIVSELLATPGEDVL